FGTVVVDAGALLDPEGNGNPGGGPMQAVFGSDNQRRKAEHPNTLARKNADQLRGKTHIRVGCGSVDSLLPRNQALHEVLADLKIEHQYMVVPDVAHNAGLYYKQ